MLHNPLAFLAIDVDERSPGLQEKSFLGEKEAS